MCSVPLSIIECVGFFEMRKLDYTDEVFGFLRNLSFSVEPLLKIAAILVKPDDTIDQEGMKNT